MRLFEEFERDAREDGSSVTFDTEPIDGGGGIEVKIESGTRDGE